jgi:hypothetical protein
MKWLLLWLLEDLQRLLNPMARDLSRLRGGRMRARSRQEHHAGLAKRALKRCTEILKRVRELEASSEAPLEDLVAARRELLVAEGDLRHHQAHAAAAEEALRLMEEDRARMAAGDAPKHRERYAELLDR